MKIRKMTAIRWVQTDGRYDLGDDFYIATETSRRKGVVIATTPGKALVAWVP